MSFEQPMAEEQNPLEDIIDGVAEKDPSVLGEAEANPDALAEADRLAEAIPSEELVPPAEDEQKAA